jgi:hypothetical protein
VFTVSSMVPTLSAVDQLISARVAARVVQAALPSATVEMFLQVLVSKLTQQDQKEMKREMAHGGRGNIYRLGLLLEAKDKVEREVSHFLKRDDPEAMEALKTALQRNFNSNFPPLVNVLKQIDNWVTKNKKPTLV